MVNTRSNDDSKKLKRAGTMQTTAAEGKELLEGEGFEDTKGERETRSKKRTREVVDDLLAPNARSAVEMTEEELEKYKLSLNMVFRLFDSNKDDQINKQELTSALRSVGKKVTNAKVNKIFESADKDNKGSINSEQFVGYLLEKQKLKSEKKKEEKEEKKPKKEEEKTKKEAKPKSKPKAKKVEAEKAKITTDKKETTKAEAPRVVSSNSGSGGVNPLKRGLSVTEFFTPYAGLHDEIKTGNVDKYNNPVGRGFDLGHESAFGLFSVIIMQYYTIEMDMKSCIEALQSKGFMVVLKTNEDEFISELHNHDQAWLISSYTSTPKATEVIEELKKFHASGKGICIWADNDPYYYHANPLIKDLIGHEAVLHGNDPGGQILKVGDGNNKGQFARHLLTTGIVTLHEGVTICKPTSTNSRMKVIGTSSSGHPCMFYTDPEKNKGPIVVDCGFTKLIQRVWETTAGTERYVRNIAVWLLSLDYRSKVGAPFKGPIDEQNEEEVEKAESTTTSTTASTTEQITA